MSSMYQDVAGTTPVTAVEQPVGLMLDQRFGLARGAELAPSLASSAGWTALVAGVTFNGSLNFAGSVAGGSLVGSITPNVAPGAYEIVYTIASITGSVSVGIAGANWPGTQRTAPGTYRDIINTTDGTVVSVISRGGGVTALVISALSVRALPGNHATQSTAAARPVLSARKNLLTYTENLADASWSKVNSATVTGAQQVNIAAVASSRIEKAIPFPVGTTITVSALLSGTGDIRFGIMDNGGAFPSTRVSATLTPTPTRYSVTRTITDAAAVGAILQILGGAANNAATVIVGEVQMEYGTAATRYQRVNTATDYDTEGFPLYLRRDGVDDWMGFSLPAALTQGTIACAIATDTTTGTNYGPNTVNITTSAGFGIAESSVAPSIQAVSGNGTTFATPNAASASNQQAHVSLASADGATVRVRYNGGAAASQASATNFNGTAWRIGRTLNDGGIHGGRDYGVVIVSRVLTDAQELNLTRWLAAKAGITF